MEGTGIPMSEKAGAADPESFVELHSGDVCCPRGFLAAGVHCGIKRKRPDLAVVASEVSSTAAAMFTRNRIKAAPVLYSMDVAAGGHAQAVVVNSGNANACTGAPGLENAREMAALTARNLGMSPETVLVASTGIIGAPLNMQAIRDGIPAAVQALERSGEAASRAILTTDRFPKTCAATVSVGGGRITIGGMAKGAGMIHPRLATTLCFLTTDAYVPAPALRSALREAVASSFNSITVDGDTSTNDAIFLLANGSSGPPLLTDNKELRRFTAGLTRVTQELARMVVRDGEGASRIAEITVAEAASAEEARRAAFRIANSLLVKTALHGGEPNWGRIMAALGSAGVEVREERIAIRLGNVIVVENGIGVLGTWDRAAEALIGTEVCVKVNLGIGGGNATVWTCDLSEEYVRINGSYAT